MPALSRISRASYVPPPQLRNFVGWHCQNAWTSACQFLKDPISVAPALLSESCVARCSPQTDVFAHRSRLLDCRGARRRSASLWNGYVARDSKFSPKNTEQDPPCFEKQNIFHLGTNEKRRPCFFFIHIATRPLLCHPGQILETADRTANPQRNTEHPPRRGRLPDRRTYDKAKTTPPSSRLPIPFTV